MYNDCHVFLYTAYMCASHVFYVFIGSHFTCLLFRIVSAVWSVFRMCFNVAYATKL